MQTYVKIDGTYLHVFIHISENILSISSDQGLLKTISRKVDLNKIDNLFVLQLYGGKQISFSYEGEQYLFYASGLGVTNYLETNLLVK